MKKTSLLKILAISLGVLVILTWIIPSGTYDSTFIQDKVNPIGIFDLFKYPIYSIATFIQYGLVILAIGIFYGVLSKTGVYSELCDEIVDKIKNKKLFLGIITFAFIFLSSIIGWPLIFFIFTPFIYDIVILLGYDKKTAFSISIGSILVGNICSLCGNSIALVNSEFFNFSLTKELFVKIIFFVMTTLLYINLVVSHSTNEKGKTIFYVKEKSKKSLLPIKVLLIFTFLVTILGVFDLSVFGFTMFSDIHNALMNFEVNGFYLFKNLFKGINGLGSWSNYDFIMFMIIMSIVISWVYTIDFDEIKKGVKEGLIKTYKPALYAIISSIIFVIMINNNSNIMESINNFILSKDFSITKTSLATISGSIFYNDYAWLIQSGFGNLLLLNDSNNYIVISILSGGIHSLLMLIFPTSVVLASGLAFTDLEYKEWLKYIWKFILLVFFAIIIISIILVKFM